MNRYKLIILILPIVISAQSDLYPIEDYYGGGIGYSLNSLVGPIDLSVNISNRAYKASFFLNIGFFF